MARCCPHPQEQHQQVPTCQEVIHYPNEDYPCLCTGFIGDGDRCASCEHPRKSHELVRVCRPATGEYCPCKE